jgi:hypothetical protein
MQKMESKVDGNVVQIPKWKYLLNWWSPILGILGAFLTGVIFLVNLEARIFDTSEQKFDTVKHTKNAEVHLNKEERANLTTVSEMKELKDEVKEINDKIDELNRYLRGRK